MFEFIGHFHPMLVHLPIGILLVAALFILLSFTERFKSLYSAVVLLLWLGILGAVFSCITGLLLAQSGEYERDLVNYHKWMGIGTALASIILLWVFKKIKIKWIVIALSVLLVLIISVTGHMGGSLTHGADYLSLSTASPDKNELKPIPNIQEAYLYKDAIQPILKSRCYSCHSAAKQKGKLRLDEEAFMLKGGEHGAAVVPGKADESTLMIRILLPLSDADHMAPKEKPQLTKEEVELIKWWINNGASFKKKVNELLQSPEIKQILKALENGTSSVSETKNNSDLPLNEVDAANEKTIKKLQVANISVFPVQQGSNYLSLNFVNASSFADTIQNMILGVKEQMLFAKFDNPKVTNKVLQTIGKCTNLRRLSLNGASINDEGLKELKDLSNLKSISLVGTKVTANGLSSLAKLKQLQTLYLYKSGVNPKDYAAIKKVLPHVTIDTGNYTLLKLATDTVKNEEEYE
ncbi:c-type cytochrome domain-containing protein [Pedobacter sp. MW01-1-1]|uniref:c-type cytochrome domain-containing protein n=1 Tax=Pedobacter sp. MW01-1-1 TaxID=3383027 RepID=UPI003FEE5DEF